MNKITRNTLLNHLLFPILIKDKIEKFRIFDFNNQKIKNGKIIYLCQREIRLKDNTALDFGLKLKIDLGFPFKVIHLKNKFHHKEKELFISKQIENTKKEVELKNIQFEILDIPKKNLLNYLVDINTSILIIDFNPIENYNFLSNAPFKIYEIDGHNIIPAKLLSNKQEYSAATIRRKIYLDINTYLKDSKESFIPTNEADFALTDFIKNKLKYYNEFKNNPTKNTTSNLSKYLNLGFISSKRVVLEILKADVENINKESFLEEIIIRKELAENFCLYCKNYKTISCAPSWAKESLYKHQNDIRDYLYSLKELQNANTHDKLWNAAQIELIKTGKIHGYIRMYWAKKILEWSNSPNIAIKNAIYLNDKYAYDSPSPNGYAEILWSIAGLHDRAFKDSFVTGKIRRMTYNSTKNKFEIEKYINKYL